MQYTRFFLMHYIQLNTTMTKQTEFLAMWCNEGLECIIDLTAYKEDHDAWEKRKMWQVLKDETLHDIEPTLPLRQMILRAKVNSQRVYEIYTFAATDGISKKQIEDLFVTNPQYIVDFIRKNGNKVYSDWVAKERVVIR